MKLYDTLKHRSVIVNPRDVNIAETRRNDDGCVDLHNGSYVVLGGTHKGRKIFRIIRDSRRTEWESRISAL